MGVGQPFGPIGLGIDREKRGLRCGGFATSANTNHKALPTMPSPPVHYRFALGEFEGEDSYIIQSKKGLTWYVFRVALTY